MWKNIRKSGAIALCLVGAQAHAFQVNWAMPTQNVDDTPIPVSGPGALTATEVMYSPCGTNAQMVSVPAPGTSLQLEQLLPGTEYCVVARVVNTFGQYSELSNTISRVTTPPTPKPPILSVTTLVWELKANKHSIVGSAPIGSLCSPDTHTVAGVTYNEISRDLVNLKKRGAKTLITRCAA